MSLSKDDLHAIKNIVEDAKEDLKIDVAAGFAEVHGKFGEVHGKFAEVHGEFAEVHGKIDELADDLATVKDTVGRIENVQRAEVSRVDKLEVQVRKLKTRAA